MWRDRFTALGGHVGLGVRRLLVAPAETFQRNVYFLYTEIVFASVLSAAASFNSAYVIRLGGSNALVGLLTSLPALIAIFTYLPSARILERQTNRMPWVVGSLFLARIGYLAIVFLPLLLDRGIAEVTLALLVAPQAAAVFFSTAWSPLLADVIPPSSRANVLAWRSILSSGAIAPLIFLAGKWLDATAFPANYQWMYLVGAIGGGVSTFLVSRIRLQPVARPTPVDRARREPTSPLSFLRDPALGSKGFTRIVVNTLLFNLGAWMISPLFTIFYVRELGATDGWIGYLGTVAHVGVIIGYFLWRRLVPRMGESRALLISAPLVCIHPLLVALVPDLRVILVAEFVIQLIAAGVNLSHSMIFLELLPEEGKYSATAIYSMVMNIGAFLGPLAGVALAEAIGIIPTLLIGGVMRLLGGFLFRWLPIERPQPVPAPQPALAADDRGPDGL